jgi:DNA-binding XRE family transcriptional regulator
METKNVILELRNKHGLSQDELAEKVFVTRQAVSRWETGDTVPNTETLSCCQSFLMFPSTHFSAHRDS